MADTLTIQRKTTGAYADVTTQAWTGSPWTDPAAGLTDGVTYWYRAKRTLDGVDSDWSNEVSVAYDLTPSKAVSDSLPARSEIVSLDTGAPEAPPTGETSQDRYGIRRGKIVNKDWKDLATASAELTRLVNAAAFPQYTYRAEVPDTTAALCIVGDTGHFVFRGVNLTLRILEIVRQNDGTTASMVLGDTAETLADIVAGTRRELATLQKSYQGSPTDSNDSFSEAFERTLAGVDVPAEVAFYVPYAADLQALRLRYQVGGMRAYAKAVGGGGGVNTPSGGGSTTPSGGGSTSGASSKSTADAVAQAVTASTGVSRRCTADATYYDVVAPNVGSYTTRGAYATVQDQSGSSATYYYQWRQTNENGAIVVDTTAITIGGFGTQALYHDWSAYTTAACFMIKRDASANFDVTCSMIGYSTHSHGMEHTHTTPAHTHATPDHVHALPDHAHTLSYGIYESGIPATVRVALDGVTIPALDDLIDVSDFDLLPFVGKNSNGRVAEGWHTLAFATATDGTTGGVRGTVFGQKFLSTEAS